MNLSRPLEEQLLHFRFHLAQVGLFDGDADLLCPFQYFLFKITNLDLDSFPFSTRMMVSLIDLTRSISFILGFISTEYSLLLPLARGQSWFGSGDIVGMFQSSGWHDSLAIRSLHFISTQ